MSIETLVNEVSTFSKVGFDANEDAKIAELHGVIGSLLALYNAKKGKSFILADYSTIAREIKAIDEWKGQAFQTDDDVDYALQAIATHIDFPRNGSIKAIIAPPKKEYHLYCYYEGSYNSPADAIEVGGNYDIESFMVDNLTIEMLTDSVRGNVVIDAISIANNALHICGRIEDYSFFITTEDPKNVLFYQNPKGEWVEKEDQTISEVDI